MTQDPKKAQKHEKKGDKLLGKAKFREALEQYQLSEALDPSRREIYEKLVETLGKMADEWSEEDFSNSLTWTMRKQELDNPELKLVHEKFSLEYQKVQKLVQQLMLAPTEAIEDSIRDQILSFEQKAVLPLIHVLISLKKMASQPESSSEAILLEEEINLEEFDLGAAD